MNKLIIDGLLEKYWDAETTLEEEETLASYFNTSYVDPSHLQYKSLFNFFESSSHIESSKHISLNPELIKDFETSESVIVRFRPLMKYAAALLFLIFGYGIFLNQYSLPQPDTQYAGKYTKLDTVEETEEALEITLEALGFLTAKINNTENTIIGNFEPIQKAMRVIQ